MILAKTKIYLQIAFATPVRRLFDYRYGSNSSEISPQPGQRIIVPFGKQLRIGLIVNVNDSSSLDDDKLKTASTILDEHPILNQQQCQLAEWASRYYHHSLGEILFSMLPIRFRKNQAFQLPSQTIWQLTADATTKDLPSNASRQQQCLNILLENPDGLAEPKLISHGIQRSTLVRLAQQNYIRSTEKVLRHSEQVTTEPGPNLSHEQAQVISSVKTTEFGVYLLNGITGSGKTEVYIQLILSVLTAGKQALMLVPEIGLTPQSVTRLRRRIQAPVRVLHSGLNEREQAEIWALATQIEPQVVIATRSGLFAPLPELGLIVVDEEHDASYKQMSGWQYSARDLAIVRAKQAGIPVMLGTATPSLESYYKAQQEHYQELKLIERPGAAKEALYQVLDIRKLPLEQGLSIPLLDMIRTRLQRDEQVLIFLNRRGYAPVLMCHDCGWLATCSRCDSQFTLHQSQNKLECHHCHAIQRIPHHCPDCKSTNVTAVGQGTERIEETLRRHFNEYKIARIDRDSTRRKGAMQDYIEGIKGNKYQLLVGTQMLAKGHHFPNLSLVVIVDMDAALYCADFRATERFGQLLKQVAGRAGRAEKQGHVVIQSRQPDHPHLQRLISEDYDVFLSHLLEERQQTQWPPVTHLALLKAEATREQSALDFLDKIKALLSTSVHSSEVSLLGPTPAIQYKRAGKYRYHLLLQCSARQELHQCINEMINQIETQKLTKSVRWTLDVDPIDLV